MSSDLDVTQARNFLSGVLYRYALSILSRTCKIYELDEEQEETLKEMFMNPTEWSVTVTEKIELATPTDE